MKIFSLIFIYIGSFFAVAFACGYSPIAIYQIFPYVIYAPGLNGFELYWLPLKPKILPLLFLSVVYGIGFFCTYFLSDKKTAWDFRVFRKNLFTGLICIGGVLSFFQFRGQADFLREYLELDLRNLTLREQLPAGLREVIPNAALIRERYSGRSVSLELDMGPDCSRDPCFYIQRGLQYYLYPIDVIGVRGEPIEETLKIWKNEKISTPRL